MKLKIILLLFLFIFLLPVSDAQYSYYFPIIFKSSPTLKGFLLPRAYYEHCAADVAALNADWFYINWPENITNCPTDNRYIPKLFKGDWTTPETIALAVQSAQLSSGWISGFDEPNLSWGGDVTPLEGAKLWRKIETAALPAGVKLIAPTPSQHEPCYFSCEDNPYGYTWIWEMVDQYEALYGEKPTFHAFGWNVFMSSPTEMTDYLLTRRAEALGRGYDLPFWIMSYAGKCWHTDTAYPTGNEAVMTEMTDWFEAMPWITRIAWFTHRIRADDPWALNHHSCTLVDPDTGELTELGLMYRGY